MDTENKQDAGLTVTGGPAYDTELNNKQDTSDEEFHRMELRAAKRAKMKRRKRRQEFMRKVTPVLIPVALVALVALFILTGIKRNEKNKAVGSEEASVLGEISENAENENTVDAADDGNEDTAGITVEEIPEETVQAGDEGRDSAGDAAAGQDSSDEEDYSEEKALFFDGYKTGSASGAAYPSEDEVYSTYALLVDAGTGEIIASKSSDERINPASMTKIMTVLVAAEHVTDLSDRVTMDSDILNYIYVNDCSAVGFAEDETVTVEDLMYGTILPSGADAALQLARYVAGSEDAFVELMNDKLEELSLNDTAHFTNCIGIYDDNHYCTLNDMAMIMKAAVENSLAKKVLETHVYTTSKTSQHPDGITVSNWFLRRIEDKDTHGEVLCAKTGFVNESGCCAASYEKSNDGNYYICVTADAWSSWRCIYDHVAIYDAYVK